MCLAEKYGIGTLHETKNYGTLEIIGKLPQDKRLVKFLVSGHEKITRTNAIGLGTVKDPFYPKIYGVGYIGEGKYSTKHEKAYYTWHSMLQRCYDSNFHVNNPTYKGCIVCDSWHCFQNFAEWLRAQPNSDSTGYALDKDLFGDGKAYSSDTCTLLPISDNSRLAQSTRKAKGTPNTEAFQVTHPTHGTHTVLVQVDFCNTWGLCPKGLSALKRKKNKTHKDWRLVDNS